MTFEITELMLESTEMTNFNLKWLYVFDYTCMLTSIC